MQENASGDWTNQWINKSKGFTFKFTGLYKCINLHCPSIPALVIILSNQQSPELKDIQPT